MKTQYKLNKSKTYDVIHEGKKIGTVKEPALSAKALEAMINKPKK